MCGITGIVDLEATRPINQDRLLAMTSTLLHRGPDGGEIHTRPGCGFGHRRLAIIDLAGGAQPVHSADGRFTLTFNGEIYNYKSIRAELIQLGHQFHTESDTEVLLKAWVEWRGEALSRIKGMFAFAVWDETEQTLTLARDGLGEKPLYYSSADDGLFLFGSEIGAVLAGLSTPPGLNNRAVADYFAYGYVPDPKTIFEGIHKLPPGHFLTLRRGATEAAKPVSYWSVRFSNSANLTEAEAAEEAEEAEESAPPIEPDAAFSAPAPAPQEPQGE